MGIVRPTQWFAGIGASEGIAIGPVQLLAANIVVIDRSISSDQVPRELHRLQEAIVATDEQLLMIGRQLEAQNLREGYLIVEAHRLMLKSDELVEAARGLISSEGIAAECAVRRVVDRIVATFEKMRDPYLRERSADVEAMGERLLGTLLGLPEVGASCANVAGSIGVGPALSPIDAFHLGRINLAGIITERGGKTAHAAMIVRALQLPYVLGVRGLCGSVQPGDILIVDGGQGDVVVNPDHYTLTMFQ